MIRHQWEVSLKMVSIRWSHSDIYVYMRIQIVDFVVVVYTMMRKPKNQFQNVLKFRYTKKSEKKKKIYEKKINMKRHKNVTISKYYRISCSKEISNVIFDLQFMQIGCVCLCVFFVFSANLIRLSSLIMQK